MNIEQITKVLEGADRAAGSVVGLAERAAGALGRGGPRWHRWRTIRLRLRAVRVQTRGRVDKARELRTLAGIHLAHAVRLEALDLHGFNVGEEPGLQDLLRGLEPLA